MSDIERAAQALRDSADALPDGSGSPWRASRHDVRTEAGFEICGIGTAPSVEEAAHIARTASPDVVTALADLLDAIRHHGEHIADYEDVEWSADRLAALILRDQP